MLYERLLLILLFYANFKLKNGDKMFYKVSEKEMLKDRNEIFLKDIVPILKEKGFEKSPFKSACFGYCNSYLYIYEMCRLNSSLLEFVETDICRKDKYIQIHINSFKLTPEIRSVSSLNGIDGLNYKIPPDSTKKMRLDVDFIDCPPVFSMDFWFKTLKIGYCFTKKGYARQVKRLKNLAQEKVRNIDCFFKKWYTRHSPNITEWDGKLVEKTI